MWEEEEIEGMLENISIVKMYKNKELSIIKLLPHNGYVLHDIKEKGYTDEKGEYHQPYYSTSVYLPIDADIKEYEAVLIEKEKEV